MTNVTGFRRFNNGWGGDAQTASTAQTLPNHGVSALGSTSGADLSYHLAAPIEGIVKALCVSGTSTGQTVSSTASGATFITTGATTHTTLTLPKGASACLWGLSTSQWALVSNSGSVVPS